MKELNPFALCHYPLNAYRVPLAQTAVLHALCWALVMTSFHATAGALTWDASGANPATPTDGPGIWDPSAANWSEGGTDMGWNNGSSAIIGVNNGAAGTISITNSAGVIVSNITYSAAGTGSYNISGSTLLFTGNPTVTVANGVNATNSSILGGTGFIKAGTGRLVLTPSAAATNVGPVIVNAGTLQLAATAINSVGDDVVVNPGATLLVAASAGIPTGKALILNGGALTNYSAANTTWSQSRIVFDNNAVLASATAISQINVTNLDLRSGMNAFPKWPSIMITNCSVKSTPGTAIIQTRANSSGVNGIILSMNAGTLIIDYPNPAPDNDTTGGAKFINTLPLTLGGGTLFFRFNALANRTEAVGGTTINPGATFLQLTNGSAANNYAFSQKVITRKAGGTADYSLAGLGTGTANFTTTSTALNGILGGWATWAGSDWATLSGANFVGYSAYQTAGDPTTWLSTDNVALSANPSLAVPDGTIINSLKLSGTATVTLNGTMTLSSGGLLLTGAGANSITGGTLKGASGTDLILHQYGTGDVTINSALADNGTATSLTKSGPGKVILAGANSMTGTNYLNGGSLEVSDLTQLAAGPLVMNNGTLRYTGPDTSNARAITVNGIGAILDVPGSTTFMQTAAIISGGGVNSPIDGVNMGDWGGLTKIGTGTLLLAGNNTYNGPTVVSNGVLLVNATNSLTGISGLTNYLGGGAFLVFGGTLGGTGLLSGPVTIKNGGAISPGDSAGTFLLKANLTMETGSTARFEVGNSVPGNLLIVQGNLAITNGSSIALSILNGPLPVGTYTLIQYSGSKTGSFSPTPVVEGGTIDGSYVIDDSVPGQINLVVSPQVAITTQPADTLVSVNQDATLVVAATGTAPLSYKWYFYGDETNNTPTAISYGTNSSLTITNAQSSDSGFYAVVVSNNYNAVTSRFATLIVGDVAPVIAGPTNTTTIAGNSVTFNVAVIIANPPPSLQWQTNGVDLPGATSPSLTLNNVPYALNGATISVIATNVAGSATNNAILTVIVTPAVSTQPTNIAVNVGDTAVFTAAATGVPTPSLQWYKNGVAISGQTGNTLTIAAAKGTDIGTYSLVASNAAGTATSLGAKLTVISTTLALTGVTPANGAGSVCYDTPLYVTFNAAISNVNSGQIRIYNANDSSTPVDVLDMSSNNAAGLQRRSLFQGDTNQPFNYYPVIVSGSSAAIYPHSGVMTSNQTYFVAMDSGIFADSSGAYFAGISDTNAWRFTTKPAGPVNPTNLVVAADGSGDFVTVQGAVDSLPLNNTVQSIINIQNGNYVEIVNISSKNNVSFRGQNRTGTVVGYPNNNNINGTTHSRMAFKVNANDIAIENLTISNSTPQGGSQAEALMLETGARRFILNNADVNSRQDTILGNVNSSQGYFYNSIVRGNFDYIWGGGNLFFTNCEMRTILGASSYNLTAARTDNGATGNWLGFGGLLVSNGFSFVKCQLTRADNSITNVTLAGSNGSQNGQVAWIGCSIDTNCYRTPSATVTNSQLLWEYANSNLDNTASVAFGLIQLTNNDPRLLAAQDATTWLNG